MMLVLVIFLVMGASQNRRMRTMSRGNQSDHECTQFEEEVMIFS
jgi:adenine deaminase